MSEKKFGLSKPILTMLFALVFTGQTQLRGQVKSQSDLSTRHLPVRAVSLEPSDVEPEDFHVSPQVEVYGNFHTIGLIVTLPNGMAAADITTMRSSINIDGKWSPQHPLVQVGNFDWYATSIFWLNPASTYQFKVEAIKGGDQVIATWYGEGTTRSEPVLQESGEKLYVATNGDDNHPGTIDQPFKTLAHGFSKVSAGQTLLIRGGIYYEGQLALASNGRDGAPIVIRAYPGETVILDGTDPSLMDASKWQNESNRIYSNECKGGYKSATLIGKSDGQVIRLFPVRELEHLSTRKIPGAGTFDELGIKGAIYCDGKRVHIAIPEPLDHYDVHVSGQNRGIVLENRKHVQIDGLELNHYGDDLYTTAIFVLSSSDVLIQNCRFHYDDSHVYVKLNSDRLTIQNCLFVDAVMEWPFDYMKGDSGISGHFEGGAVNVDAKFNGRGLVFRRNQIRDVFDGVHLTPWTVDTATTNEIDFYENHIDGCVDDFIEADGFARNVRIFDNYMNRSLSGISVAQALDGPTFAVYNVIANCGMVPAAQRADNPNYGYPFKTNGGSGAEIGSGPMFFYHNTAFTLDPNSRAMLVKRAKWKKITCRNNIWAGKAMGFELWPPDPSPMDFDYDDLYVAKSGQPLVLQAYRTKVMTLTDVRAKYGWLKHGISADPKLANARQGDFSLSNSSPCIDRGILVPGINDLRTKGKSPDLGAYENR